MRPLILLFVLLCLPIAASSSEESDWLRAISEPVAEPCATKAPAGGVVSSDLVLARGDRGAHGLRAQADANLKSGNYLNAISLLEDVLEKSPDDLTSRMLYARALELHYEKTGATSATLFNKCVKQWFKVFKTAEFLEDSKLAEERLFALTGKKPRLFSKASNYLPAVLRPEGADEAAQLAEPPQVH